jgi:predicted aspartyl protease
MGAVGMQQKMAEGASLFRPTIPGWARVAVLGGVILSGCAPSSDNADCPIDQFVQFPVTYTSGGLPVVDAVIDGKHERLLIDTGSAISTLTPAAAAALHLTNLKPSPLTVEGLGGLQRALPSTYLDILIQDITVKNTLIMVTATQTKTSGEPADIEGTIGNNAMDPFDIDFDFPENRVTFYLPRNCEPEQSPPPWKTPDTGTIFMRSINLEGYFPVTLDGKRVPAVVDTGTSFTTVSTALLVKYDIQPVAISKFFPGAVFVYGPNHPKIYFAEFDKFEIGAELYPKPLLAVSDDKAGLTNTFIGMSYLRHHRVFMANSVWMIYFGLQTTPGKS